MVLGPWKTTRLIGQMCTHSNVLSLLVLTGRALNRIFLCALFEDAEKYMQGSSLSNLRLGKRFGPL